MDTANKANATIIVGIALDPFFEAEDSHVVYHETEMRKLLQAAGSIAHKTGASLRLVSVWENKIVDMAKAVQRLPDFDWQSLKLDSLLKDARMKIQEKCEKQLAIIADKLPRDTAVTKLVTTAKYPAQGILAEAEAQRASLIILGAGTKADKYLMRGYSTALTTMAATTVPVLVIGGQCETDFSSSRLRMLLADDLREITEAGMRSSIEWIKKLGVIDLMHVHIEEMDLSRVKQVLGTAAVELRSTVEWQRLSADLLHSLDLALKERLRNRIPGVDDYIGSRNGTLQREVRRCAFVREEIERAANEFQADLLVFGRHEKVHHRPFMVGRVTYQAMLSQKRAVMVMP